MERNVVGNEIVSHDRGGISNRALLLASFVLYTARRNGALVACHTLYTKKRKYTTAHTLFPACFSLNEVIFY
jgi:hypothetical protein